MRAHKRFALQRVPYGIQELFRSDVLYAISLRAKLEHPADHFGRFEYAEGQNLDLGNFPYFFQHVKPGIAREAQVQQQQIGRDLLDGLDLPDEVLLPLDNRYLFSVGLSF
mgnify:CR=1 FL=1